VSTAPGAQSHFLSLPDLASRSPGGAVVWANDDLFAEKETLINPGPAEHWPATFGHKGQVYDGWETRRRRGAATDAHDSAIVRLGVPGIVRGVVVDTAWFTGNYPADLRGGPPTCPATRRLTNWWKKPSGPRSSSAATSTAMPETRSRSTHPGAGRMCGCRSIRTAVWRAYGCTARGCSTPVRRPTPGPGGDGERRPDHRVFQHVLQLAQ
jgi:hypothetical protein